MRIHVRNNLAAPHSGKDSPVYALISGKLRLSDGLSLSSIDPATLWTSGWWGLSNDSTYRKLRPELQKQVLRACNSTLLNEAYFVEKSGLAYSAKMVLSASSTDIAQLYTLIGADEAKHLAWVEPYIEPDQKTRPAGQFLAFLSKLIEDVSPRLLVYLVQIILEGWGLDHYRRLANGCSRPHFSALLLNILRDEALHHRSGNLLFDARALAAYDFSLIRDSLKLYAEMVRVGPQAAIAAMDEAVGGLSAQEVQTVVLSLRHPKETARKLTLLKSLMRQPGVEALVDRIDQLGYFDPMTPAEVARIYIARRSEK